MYLIGAAVSDVEYIACAVSADHGSNQGSTHAAQIITELRISPSHTVGLFTCLEHQPRIVSQPCWISGEITIEIVHKCFGRELACKAAGVCASHSVTECENRTRCLFAVFNQKAVLVFLSDFSLVCESKAIHCLTFSCVYVILRFLVLAAELSAGCVDITSESTANRDGYTGILQCFLK